MTGFKELNIKNSYFSGGENIPLEFYDLTFPASEEIWLFLGYFSTNAIRELSMAFSSFIINGGNIKIITNHSYSKDDYENLILNKEKINNEDRYIDIFDDFEKLEKELSKYGTHFFDCLKFLIKKKRIMIQPVRWKGGNAHTKNMIMCDGENYVLTDGSLNFTLSGLTINGERFKVTKSWKDIEDKQDIEQALNDFNKVFNKENSLYEYLDSKSIYDVVEKIGKDKDKNELISNSIDLIKSKNIKIDEIREKRLLRYNKLIIEYERNPKFPFPSGPRKYQNLAYEKWLMNNKKGIFNMATGTGKTITSLNFVLNEFKENKQYQVIILVPTVALLHQWEEECYKFNFSERVITTKDRRWKEELDEVNFDIKDLKQKRNYVFITTYANFQRKDFQSFFIKIDTTNAILIADECHNVGTRKLIKLLPQNITARIGLSATPERKYDFEGSQQMYEYFNSFPDCFTFSYSMYKAIKNNVLCKYYYHPIFCTLNEDELKKYKSYSKRLIIEYDEKTGRFTDYGTQLLIDRKRVIHKAKDKLKKLEELLSVNKNLEYTFIYVPEGKEVNYEEEDIDETEDDLKIINEYLQVVQNIGYRAKAITGTTNDRENSLNKFKEGRIDMLLAMKILDEGVDIPITSNAIFCSSTGNPRQFIQRRGRVLRTHEKKKYATIWDMVVIPNIELDNHKENLMEKNILKTEILRVANFVYSSKNVEDFKQSELADICKKFGIDLDDIISQNIQKDKLCDYE